MARTDQFPDLYKFDTRIISNVEIAGTIVGFEQNNTMVIYTGNYIPST
jgi:hypothetical protein